MTAGAADGRVPQREEAEALLAWAHGCNPGPWEAHCRVAGRAAQTIARAAGMDEERAYVCALLHDIGWYEGVRALHHVLAGYRLITDKGYPGAAGACMTHSFPAQDLRSYSGALDCTPREIACVEGYLAGAVYSDMDRLVQLCDALASAKGVCFIDLRLLDVVRRHGSCELLAAKLEATFSLKRRFDALCGRDLYELFLPEVLDVSLGFHA